MHKKNYVPYSITFTIIFEFYHNYAEWLYHLFLVFEEFNIALVIFLKYIFSLMCIR